MLKFVNTSLNYKIYVLTCLLEGGKIMLKKSINKAFTLSEVLIALAVIGIVAALTIPELIQNYKKTAVETKLKQFYAMANQAIQLSEIDNGPKESWEFKSAGCTSGYEEICLRTFFERYLEKYLKYNKVEYINAGDEYGLLIYLSDGSAIRLAYAGHDYILQTDVKHNKTEDLDWGKNAFLFGFYPNNTGPYFENKGIIPYVSADCRASDDLSKNKECLYKARENYVRIIELNNWKIPQDYPVKL